MNRVMDFRASRIWVSQILCGAVLFATIAALPAHGRSFADIPRLEAGSVVERKIAPGEIHVYQIQILSGQYLHALIEQLSADVSVGLLGPDGTKRIEVDNPNGPEGAERVSLIADESGSYRFEIRGAREDAEPGQYALRIKTLRSATPEDGRRLEAERAFLEAEMLRHEGTAELLRRAVELHEKAASLWKDAGDLEGHAEALVLIGDTLFNTGQTDKALEYSRLALAGARQAGQTVGEARALTLAGAVYSIQGQKEKALESFRQAAPLWRSTGYRYGLAVTLHNTAVVYDDLREREKALKSYREVLPLWKALAERGGEAGTLSGIGVIENELGETQRALDAYQEALRLIRQAGDKRGEGSILSNIGIVYDNLGETQKALSYFSQALSLAKEVGSPRQQASALTAIGKAYADLGQTEKARNHYEESLSLARQAKSVGHEGTALTRLGSLFESLGDQQKALDYQQKALEIRQASGDRSGVAAILNRMGAIHDSLGEPEKALDLYERALALVRAAKTRSLEAETYYRLAETHRRLGRPRQALDNVESAIQVIDSVRTRVGNPDLRSSYLAAVHKTFELHIDLLMELHRREPAKGFDAAALAAAERGRARSLVELLREARAEIRQGVNAELLERETDLRRRLAAKTEQRIRLLNSKHTEEQAAAAEKEILELTAEHDQLQTQIRSESPRYAALTQPQAPTLSEIQRELDPQTVLLEYALGKERSFLWAVTPDVLASYELPKRSVIEDAARRAYELLTARNRRVKSETAPQRRARLAKADREYADVALSLSELLLGPVAGQLGTKRVLIVADGALQYLPFAVLPVIRKAGRPVPLVVEHEVVNLPSASVLTVLRRDVQGREPASGVLAVLADPVFEKEDERVAGSPTRLPPDGRWSGRKNAEPDLLRSAADMGAAEGEQLRIPRLPFTRWEARSILDLTPAGTRREALDFDASRGTAMSSELGHYRFVHFATHGFLNSLHPELSGLILSLVDREGREVPGFLSAADVFNLQLPVEMVVLSGCRTALGKEIKGEGLVGLTRGFMYAGAVRVVASLWRVEDVATAELMSRFYREMLGPKHIRPAAALRQAQLSMWREKRWRSPYYWSAFLLQGEWR